MIDVLYGVLLVAVAAMELGNRLSKLPLRTHRRSTSIPGSGELRIMPKVTVLCTVYVVKGLMEAR